MGRMDTTDVEVRGDGIVGRSLALLLARQGLSVALSAPRRHDGPGAAPAEDVRAYALNGASVRLLEDLRVWPALPPTAATAVHEMRIHGDAPGARLGFSAYEQCVDALAWIVDAAALEEALAQGLRFAPGLRRLAPDETVRARLVAIAEGRHSTGRDALGVPLERHAYGHTALAARLVADAPHRHAAWQWFGAPDVLALLPFDRPQAERSYTLVWSLPAARAAQLVAASPEAFEAALAEATGGAAGALRLGSERQAWPLAIARAARWSGEGWALLGDAAHVVHPLAGQGLNLGLADAAALARTIAAREPWRSPGDARLLRRYERERSRPTFEMGRLTDGLWHLFASPAGPARELRNRGLNLVDHLPPLKRWLARQALG